MILPFEVKSDPFEKSVRGMFGRFVTNESYELNYLLTSLPIKNIDQLHTATEAFDISNIDFEQLIQRDIDFERVEKIVQGYLENGKNRVVFFPPLLVSLLSKEDGVILEKYSKIDAEKIDANKTFTQTWDTDKFQLILPISSSTADPAIVFQGETINIYNFGANLKYNPSSVSLVVIDGQHRLTALQHLAKSTDPQKKDIVKDVEIPLCIVFSPNALSSTKTAESITNNLRELFVTINLKGKQVSGHFITLLDDNSLAATATRDLADYWKKRSNEQGYSYLHFLEWNQRELRLASSRQRAYSITTVSIISDCLKENLFDDNLTVHNLLNLLPFTDELSRLDDSVAPDEISENNFAPAQLSVLKKQISESITPALDVLLLKPSPYVNLEKRFNAACKWLDGYIASGYKGASPFKSDVLQQYRDITKFDTPAVQDIAKQFYNLCKATEDDKSAPFFLNVFQQGLIRSWISLSRWLNKYEITPPQVATALVPALEIICFNNDKSLFDTTRQYTQLTLFNGNKVIVNKKSKELWVALILSTLANDKVIAKFTAALEGSGVTLDKDTVLKLKDTIKKLGLKNADAFMDDYKTATMKDYEKNWRNKDLQESTIVELTKYSEAGDEDSRGKFETYILKLTNEKVESSATILSNQLEINKEDLFNL